MIDGIHKGMRINPPRGIMRSKTGRLVVKVCNAFLNLQVKDGPQFDFSISDRNAVLTLPNSGSGSGSGSGTALLVVEYLGDYLRCDDGSGSDVYVALAPEFRTDVTSETLLSGTTWSYASYTNATQTRIADDGGGTTETQQITPNYLAGLTIIVAISVNTGLDDPNGNPITLIEANVAGRSWAVPPV